MYPHYQRVQRGRGIGGFFRTIMRLFSRAAPVISKIAANPTVKKMGKQALKSAIRIGDDTIQSKNFKASVNKEINNVKNKVGNAILKRAKVLEKQPKRKKRSVKTSSFSAKKKKKRKSFLD